MSTKTTTFLDNLHTWSRQAARAQLDQRVPLTDTIGKIAREQALAPEQIRRLCEAANHEVFAELFKQGDEQLFAFPVADYATVIGQLHGAATDAKRADERVSDDYARAPADLAVDGASILDHVFRHMFPKSAQDSVGIRGEDPGDRVRLLMNRKTATLAELQSRKIAAELEMDAAEQQLYQHVRQEILSGQSVEQVFQAIHNLYPATDLEGAGSTFRRVLERLKAENLVDPRTEKEDFSPEPRLVNRESPVARSVVHYQKEARQRRVAERAILSVQREINDLRSLLRVRRLEAT